MTERNSSNKGNNDSQGPHNGGPGLSKEITGTDYNQHPEKWSEDLDDAILDGLDPEKADEDMYER